MGAWAGCAGLFWGMEAPGGYGGRADTPGPLVAFALDEVRRRGGGGGGNAGCYVLLPCYDYIAIAYSFNY